MFEAEDGSTPWQRVLWLRQPQYPDNHLDDSFLDSLQRNVNVKQYTYQGLVLDTLPVTQHLCSIMTFVAVFTHLYSNELDYSVLLVATAASSILGYLAWETLTGNSRFRMHVLTSALVLSTFLLLLSPILQTLSKATTSDSIWPLSATLLGLNAILSDYGADPAETWQPLQFPSSLSVNAAISASVVLSSRLASYVQVFALVLFSVEWFALLPILRKELQRTSSAAVNVSVTLGHAMLAQMLLIAVSPSISILYTAAILALQFGIPLWLLRLQTLKNELRGPWDAAVPTMSVE